MNYTAIVHGELASKSNSRQLVSRGGRPMIIKSKKALDYKAMFLRNINKPKEMIKSDVVLIATIYYASRRPDLDESLLMDCIEKAGIIKNDRQIKEKHIYHGLDKDRPRVEFEVIEFFSFIGR